MIDKHNQNVVRLAAALMSRHVRTGNTGTFFLWTADKDRALSRSQCCAAYFRRWQHLSWHAVDVERFFLICMANPFACFGAHSGGKGDMLWCW